MVASSWAFSGYTFPFESQPTRGGAGDWNKARKVVRHEPINSDIDVLTNYGFTSGRRTITGRCSKTFRDTMKGHLNSLTIADLVDGDGESQSCQIWTATFDEIIPGVRYDYTIEFIAR